MFRILLHFPERDNRWILKEAFLPGKARLEGAYERCFDFRR
jgi:hypothetical protein